MKRGDFIRNAIMGLAVSMLPKVLQPALPEIVEVVEPVVQPALLSSGSKQMVSALQLLTPQYYKAYVEKYASEDFQWWLTDEKGEAL